MDKYCKGCKYHHSAGRAKPEPILKKFNDWCCAKGAPVDIGHCKTMGLRSLKDK